MINAKDRIKWDNRFLKMAREISTWSKDPSTQCGAVIVRPDKTIVSLGYNGFPRGMPDNDELLTNRDEKLFRVVHAEMNAILTAREPLLGYTLYVWPFSPCERCAVHIIQSGIKRVVYPITNVERWAESFQRSRKYMMECGLDLGEMRFNE